MPEKAHDWKQTLFYSSILTSRAVYSRCIAWQPERGCRGGASVAVATVSRSL